MRIRELSQRRLHDSRLHPYRVPPALPVAPAAAAAARPPVTRMTQVIRPSPPTLLTPPLFG